jgi:hypothetical protein
MGRFDKTYSEEQRTELISLVTEQAWTITSAADKLEMPGRRHGSSSPNTSERTPTLSTARTPSATWHTGSAS